MNPLATRVTSFAGPETFCPFSIHYVANPTREDGGEFFEIACKVPVRTSLETFPLTAGPKP